MVRIQILASLGNDGEMTADGDGEILQDHVLAADQSDSFIAEPLLLMAFRLPGYGLLGVSALQHILQDAALFGPR